MNTLRLVCKQEGELSHLSQLCRGGQSKTKSTIPPHRSLLASVPNSLLLAHLPQNQLVAKQKFVMVILCYACPGTWAISLHIISKAPTAFQMAACLSHSPLTFWSLTDQSTSLSGVSRLNLPRDLQRCALAIKSADEGTEQNRPYCVPVVFSAS